MSKLTSLLWLESESLTWHHSRPDQSIDFRLHVVIPSCHHFHAAISNVWSATLLLLLSYHTHHIDWPLTLQANELLISSSTASTVFVINKLTWPCQIHIKSIPTNTYHTSKISVFVITIIQTDTHLMDIAAANCTQHRGAARITAVDCIIYYKRTDLYTTQQHIIIRYPLSTIIYYLLWFNTLCFINEYSNYIGCHCWKSP